VYSGYTFTIHISPSTDRAFMVRFRFESCLGHGGGEYMEIVSNDEESAETLVNNITKKEVNEI